MYLKYLKSKLEYINFKNQKSMIGGKKTSIKMNIDSLLKSNESSFVFIDLNIDKNEEKILDSMVISDNVKTNMLNYFGKFDLNKLKRLIHDFIVNLGNENDKSANITNIMLNKIMIPYIKTTNKNYVWLTIRIHYPKFKIAYLSRWHKDGYFYEHKKYIENNLPQIKLAGVLKGPSTLFKKNSIGLQEKYEELFESAFNNDKFDMVKDIENREILESGLHEFKTIFPSKNQVAIFIVGLRNRAAIHSEPKIDTKRFFYSMVTGNKEEIKELAERWKEEFNE